MITCRTLGTLEIRVDGRPPPRELQWKKPVALLLYLAHSPRRTRTREHLEGLLWPDSAGPAHALSQALHTLRRWGGRDIITPVADQLRLDPTAVDLDTDRFDRLVAEGDWAAATELVGGEFLEGFNPRQTAGLDEWIQSLRVVWRGKAVDAALRCAAGLLDAGDPERALRAADRATALDRYSDAALRAQVRCLALLGRRGEALERYGAFAARVADDLDARPDPETVRLADRVRQGRPRPVPASPTTAPGRRGPLVGRGAQLGRLLRAWEQCCNTRRGAAGLVWGDAGLGKTRLAEELVQRVRLDGAALALARAVPGDTANPGAGLLALAEGGLLQAAGVPAAPTAAIAELCARSSAWAERFGERPRPEHQDLPRALVEILRAVTGEQPLLLVVDDAQWMDPESLRALLRLLRDLDAAPCFLLVAASPDPPAAEIDRLRSRLGREVPGLTVQLERFGPAELVELARWALPAYDQVQLERLARRLLADSGGIPLLGFELASAVAAGFELGRVQAPWPARDHTLDQTLPADLPDSVVGAIRVSFRRLSPNAQLALSAAAALGDRVPRRRVGAASGLDGASLDGALDELEWHRWISAEPRGYGFVARIVRDIVLRDLVSTGQRQRFLEAAGAGDR